MATAIIASGIHYRKTTPIAESHILVHAVDGSTNHKVFDNTSIPPATGNFSATSIYTDPSPVTATAIGRFTEVPDSSVMMCNGTEAVIWSGTEARCPAFLISDANLASLSYATAILYDYTAEVNNDNPGVAATLYQAADGKIYVYIGAIRPLKGVKFYPYHTNTSNASVAVNYWSGTAWTAVSSLVDGTATGAVSLYKTGLISFTSTESTAKIGVINNSSLYWYQFVWTGVDVDQVTITRCTVDMAMQGITDIWDGNLRPLSHAFVTQVVDAPQIDATVNLYSRNHVPGDMSTQLQLTNVGGYLYIGFLEPMMGLRVVLPVGNTRNTGNLQLWYWNGKTWALVDNLIDGTVYNSCGLGTTGWITWTSPASGLEQKRAFTGGPEYYYYRLAYPSILDEGHWIDYVGGLPKPHTIGSYSFATMWQNRTVLVGNLGGYKNSMLISAYGSSCVFNGSDSLEITDIGDGSAPVAAGALFTRYTGQFYDTLVICKNRETWVLDGTSVANYHLYKISEKYGCIAPETFRVLNVSYDIAQGIARQVAIWLSATGVVMFDGNTISEIDQDIKNYFQVERSESINSTTAYKSVAFVDEREREYHLIFHSGNSGSLTNIELVYSTKRKAWFKIDRGLILQCGFTAYSDTGVPYTYGGTRTGFLELLETAGSTTFDGTTIVHTIQTRDIPLSSWLMQTIIRYVKLVTRAISSVGTVTVSHFGDGSTAADVATFAVNQFSATKTFIQGKGSMDWGNYTFHSFKLVNSEPGITPAPTFEPIALVGLYQDIGLDRRTT